MLQFENHIVMVTGAGGGSGRAIAEKFLDGGAKVIALDLETPDWKEKSDTFFPVSCDVSSEEQVQSVVSSYTKTLGCIDILVNNAGIAIESPLTDFKAEIWRKIFAVNVDGPFFCTRAVVKKLIAHKKPGRIINIASIAGKNGFANSSGYCSSKAAVIGFTRALAAELGGYDITVNAVCPGSVATPMIEAVIQNISANTGMSETEARTMMESGIPLKRFQKPEDVAELVCFLASDAAKNISGESMNLDGGVVRD